MLAVLPLLISQRAEREHVVLLLLPCSVCGSVAALSPSTLAGMFGDGEKIQTEMLMILN